MLRPKREEVTGDWIKLRNEKLYELQSFDECSASDQVNENVQGGVCCTYEIEGNACGGLVGNPRRKRLLGGSSHTWQGNIKMDCKEIEWECVTRFIWLRREIIGGL